MRELLLEDRAIETGQRTLKCRYSILVGEVPVGSFSCESYGVKIEEKTTGETVELPDLTLSTRRIDELMELLMRNGVTPSGLEDVIADWL